MRTSTRTRFAVQLLFAVLLAGCAHGPDFDPQAPFEETYAQAVAALNANDFGAAEEGFRMALKKNPRHANCHYYLGTLLARRGEEEMAIVGLERAIELEPAFPEAYYNLGTLRMNRGDLDLAIKLLEESIRLNPDYPPTYVNLGKAYFLAGSLELAGAAYEEALSRDPDSIPALANLEMLARGAGEEEQAREYERRLEEARSKSNH
ncbi:tetratricopeptide repeat protein [bacterium]|nr:tetratricopeptide repeat protein [bacterium]